jgi:chromosome partitioning protein
MAIIITIANQKGGSGKTTLSTNLAAYLSSEAKVLLIDADIQQSSTDFHSFRDENADLPKFTIMSQFQEAGLRQMLDDCFDLYQYIIVDTSGRDAGLARRAMVKSHVVLIPVSPSPYDVYATDTTIDAAKDCMITNDNLQVYFVNNKVNPKTTLGQEVKKYLEKFNEDGDTETEIKLIPAVLGEREDFKRSVENGMCVAEFKPDSKAADELKRFVKELKKIFIEMTNK